MSCSTMADRRVPHVFLLLLNSSFMSFLKFSSEPLRSLTFSSIILLWQLVGFSNFSANQRIYHCTCIAFLTSPPFKLTRLLNRHGGTHKWPSSGKGTGSHLNVLVQDFTRPLLGTLLFFLSLDIHMFLLSRIIEKKKWRPDRTQGWNCKICKVILDLIFL